MKEMEMNRKRNNGKIRLLRRGTEKTELMARENK